MSAPEAPRKSRPHTPPGRQGATGSPEAPGAQRPASWPEFEGPAEHVQGTAYEGRSACPYEGDGPVDPVRELMHRYRELCERAVDPLEIAAGLEARGISDRAAARRFRHRDVFSLAEELYARVPPAECAAGDGGAPRTPAYSSVSGRGDGTPTGAARRGPRPRRVPGAVHTVGTALLPLLPGALCAGAVAVLASPSRPVSAAGPAVVAVFVTAAVLISGCVWLALRRAARAATTPLWTLLVCLLAGLQLWAGGSAVLCGGAALPVCRLPVDSAPSVALGLAVAAGPAVWCARWFAVRAGGRLAESRGLDEFAARTRPLLAACVAVFTLVLACVLLGTWLLGRATGVGTGVAVPFGRIGEVRGAGGEFVALAAAIALGLLLFTAVLLAAHGFVRAACAGLAGACLLQAAALAFVFVGRVGRLSGADAGTAGGAWYALGRPVAGLVAEVDAYGPAVVPGVVCGCVALVLLAYAFRVLARASAHDGGTAEPWRAAGEGPCL